MRVGRAAFPPGRPVLLPLAIAAMAWALAAQRPEVPVPATPRQTATRLARELELPERRAAAADELLLLGADAVEPLLAQGRHPDLRVAHAALQVLAALGPQGLAAVPELQRRAAGTDPHAAAAAWTLAKLPHRGTFVVPSMDEGVVRELNGEGKEVWRSHGIGKVWMAEIVADDRLLTAEVDSGAREYDRSGKLVWEFPANRVYTAERLVDGNTLLAVFGDTRVIEVNRNGKIVWEYGGVGALSARRLANGRTLITDYNGGKVVEVDRDGKVVWQLQDIQHSYAAERLNDGTTLVMLQQQQVARSYDQQARVVVERKLDGQVCCLLPVAGGWLHSGRSFVRRIGADGRELWRFQTSSWVGRVTPR